MQSTDSISIGFPLWTRAIARDVDRIATDTYGIHPLVLMERAGVGVAEMAMDRLLEDREAIVLAGPGNNGGDALVAARYLADAGINVHCFLVVDGPDAKLSDMCLTQKRTVEALGLNLEIYKPGAFEGLENCCIIDGIFGIGFRGSLRENTPAYKALSEAAKVPGASVLAIDIPSGIDSDSGHKPDIPLVADATITFGARKPAHVLSPAREACGDVIDIDIGFPSAAVIDAMDEHSPDLFLADGEELAAMDLWSDKPASMHKYDRGHVLVIGGSPGKTGAPLLSAMAALRAGAGWATVAMDPETFASLKGDVPREITFEDLYDGATLSAAKLASFCTARQVRGMIIGPGMMPTPVAKDVLDVLHQFANDGGFVVIDAGGLAGIGEALTDHPLVADRVLLTPHPGEWKKIADPMPDPLDAEGLQAALQIAASWQVTLVHKSAAPIVIPAESPAFVSIEGSTTLARAGSGDVFAGIAVLHGMQGCTAKLAALRALVVLARAAEHAGEEFGHHGVLARDIIQYLAGSAGD